MDSVWTVWKTMPLPEICRNIDAPEGPGVYQIRHKITKQLIQFGIGKECQKRMKSLYPGPHGVGTRNNEEKRKYILKNWEVLEYRTISTETRKQAADIETELKLKNNHLFNT